MEGNNWESVASPLGCARPTKVCPFPWDQCVPFHGIFVSLSMESLCLFPWDQCITDSRTTCLLSSTQGAVNGEQRNRGRRRSLIQDSAFSSPDSAATLRRSETWPCGLQLFLYLPSLSTVPMWGLCCTNPAEYEGQLHMILVHLPWPKTNKMIPIHLQKPGLQFCFSF